MKTRKIILKIVIIAALAAIGYGTLCAYRFWYDRKAHNFKGKIELFVYPWMSPEEVKDSILASEGVLKPSSIERVFREAEDIRPGHYVLDSTCTSIYAVRMLSKGWQTPVRLTLSGAIRTPGALARKIGAQMMADSASVASFAASADSIGLDPAMLFTRIIPDTYEMLWTTPVADIFARLFRERDAWWTPERIEAAKAQGLTPDEASTLASIVDGETRYVPEQPTIAGVYLNRLRSGMKLQADPTIAYCFGYEPRRILYSHLLVDSPYNTYTHFGLPPGPISCPPKSCLEAAIHPAVHDYIFFCADPSFNGSHRFAASYKEHLENARAFQRALTARQRNN